MFVARLKNGPEQAAPAHSSRWKSMQQSAGADNSSQPVKRQLVFTQSHQAKGHSGAHQSAASHSHETMVEQSRIKHKGRTSKRVIYTFEWRTSANHFSPEATIL